MVQFLYTIFIFLVMLLEGHGEGFRELIPIDSGFTIGFIFIFH